MARLVTDYASGGGPALRALLQPTRARAELALRLALIGALTTLVTEYYGTPAPAIAAYLVFFLNRAERTTSLILNVALVVLLTVVIALLLLIAMAVADAPGARVFAMTLGSAIFLFLASASKLGKVGAILALIVGYALDLLGFVPSGEIATRALLYAWLFIGIPAGVSVLVNLLVPPAPRRLAEEAIATRLRAAAKMLGDPDDEDIARFSEYRATGVGEVLEWLRLARIERALSDSGASALNSAAHSTGVMLFVVGAIYRDGSLPGEWRANAAAALGEMASAFDSNGYAMDIEPIALHAGVVVSAYGAHLVRDFNDLLVHYTAATKGAGKRDPDAQGFFLPDAFSNPEHVRYALKTTAAAMFCNFLYVLLDWPGIHTCFITCYIVSLGTTGETVEKLGLRIAGCLAGAAAGLATLVWIIPAITSIWGLLAVVFAGSLCGGWIAAGNPRIAYAGFQFAFAFLLCVLQDTGPAFDLTLARDRVIGILVGNAVVYLVFTRLWPVSVSQRIELAFGLLLRELSDLVRLPRTARRAGLSALQRRVAAIDADLARVAYEPKSIRPSSAWTAARREALEAVAGLEEPIALDGDSAYWSALAERFEALAVKSTAVGERGTADEATSRRVGTPPTNALQRRACAQLTILENALAAAP